MTSRDSVQVSVVDAARPSKDTAGIVARPPIVFLGAIPVAVGLDFLWPVRVLSSALVPVGWLAILLAIVLFALSAREFARAGTSGIM